MKIALISPQGALTRNKTLLKIWSEDPAARAYRDSLSGIGTGLLILAALTPPSFEVEFIDENHEKVNFNNEYDLVAITCMTQQATRAYELANNFRKKNIPVILGGIHVTTMPIEAEKYADSIVIGEGEDVWPIAIRDFLNGKLKKIYKSDFVTELNKSPMPRFDLLKPEYYKVIWLQSTRGCPRGCEFCAVTDVYGSKCRHKTIDQVIREIKFIKEKWPQFKLGFADDNMFIDRNYAKQLVAELRHLDIRWFAQTDISIAEDSELLELLKESNCMSLFIGFESISESNLKAVDRYNWKAAQLAKYPGAIEKIQSNGIGVVGSFIIGLDGDNKAVFDRTADFIIENCILAVQITLPTPLPGTRLRERLKKENRLLGTDWKNYTFTDVNFIPTNMKPEELESGLEYVYNKVYNKTTLLKKAAYFKNIYKNLIGDKEKVSI